MFRLKRDYVEGQSATVTAGDAERLSINPFKVAMLADTGDGDGEMAIGANEEKCMDIPRQIGFQYHIFLVER
jgi:hypothetical protein